MDGADHIRILRILHWVMAGIQLLGLVLLNGFLLVGEDLPAGFAVAGVLIAVFLGISLVLHVVAARGLPSRGRKASIVAACMALLNAPLGTAFGVYALLVHFRFAPEYP